MKGLIGSAITLAGMGILFFLFWMSLQEVVSVHGGYDAFMEEVINNPEKGVTFFWYEIARDMVVPLYPVDVPVLGQIFIPLDDLSPFFILAITSLISLIIWKASGLGWWMLLVIPVVFIIVSTVWLSVWVGVMYGFGNQLGMSDEAIYSDMISTQDMFDVHPAIYWLSLLGAGFVFYRGKRLIRV